NAQAGIRQARAALEAVRAQIAGTQPQTHPRVLLAESNLRSAWLSRNRTVVRSPLSGYLVRREVQLGQQVNPGKEMLAIAPLATRESRAHPLYLGLSTKVDVDVHDLNGASLSRVAVWPAAMQTNVYAEQDAGVSTEIDKIVHENLQGAATTAPVASTSP